MTTHNSSVPLDYASLALAMCYRLITTFRSVSFQRSLNKPWVGASDNIRTIQKKRAAELLRRYEWNLLGEYKNIIAYLDMLGEVKDISVKKSNRTGLCLSLDIDTFVLLRRFVCDVSGNYRATGAMQSAQFNFHESLHEIMAYLLLKDTLESGTGHSALDKMVRAVLDNKPTSFFETGYVDDLVLDRLEMMKNDSTTKYIGCFSDRLSTRHFKDKPPVKMHDDGYEFYRVA